MKLFRPNFLTRITTHWSNKKFLRVKKEISLNGCIPCLFDLERYSLALVMSQHQFLVTSKILPMLISSAKILIFSSIFELAAWVPGLINDSWISYGHHFINVTLGIMMWVFISTFDIAKYADTLKNRSVAFGLEVYNIGRGEVIILDRSSNNYQAIKLPGY